MLRLSPLHFRLGFEKSIPKLCFWLLLILDSFALVVAVRLRPIEGVSPALITFGLPLFAKLGTHYIDNSTFVEP